MRTLSYYILSIMVTLCSYSAQGQEQEHYQKKIKSLQEQKAAITAQEKEALKIEIVSINERLEKGKITATEATSLKEAAAKRRALNIENRIAIVDNEIALLERNKGDGIKLITRDSIDKIGITIDFTKKGGSSLVWQQERSWKREIKYDRRTYSDLVLAVGLNNVITEGQSLEDSPYKIGGSRFFEIGWAWRTRVFKNSNFLRFHYGVSFQYNGLKPKGNNYFVINEDGEAELQEFEFDLRKSKFRMDNLVFPVHFEFGPSNVKETDEKIRYSIYKKFRIGVGGYGGFNIGTRQKLKYSVDGERIKEKFKRDYNTNDLIYGLSAYMGVGGTLLYAKYDLNPIFNDVSPKQRNISLGLRFDL